METAYIHTHDRIRYKRCRRKWYFGSALRRHLEPADQGPNIHLWFGTGIHFALEDFHGYNRFGCPATALDAYYNAFKDDELPQGAEDMVELGMAMLDYYLIWRQNRDLYKTVWIDGEPQVEVQVQLELTELSEKVGYPVVFRGTIDRVVEDEYGDWWVQDYKTAAYIDLNKLANDPQIGNYVWAAEQHYQKEIEGMVYTQFAKKAPKPPRVLQSGELSLDKRQSTTYKIFRAGLLERYPDGNFPPKFIEFLNMLAEKESPEGDEFIRQDPVRRNIHAKESTYNNMMMEVDEMLNPDLYIYPNPTRDCSWDCEFRPACLTMDEGDDWEYLIEQFYQERGEENDQWRNRIKWPDTTEASQTSV